MRYGVEIRRGANRRTTVVWRAGKRRRQGIPGSCTTYVTAIIDQRESPPCFFFAAGQE